MFIKPSRVLIVLFLLVSPVMAEDKQELKTPADKMNYALGVNLINNVRQQGIEFDLDMVIRGMKDAAAKGELLLSTEELRKATFQYQTLMRQKQSKIKSLVAENNRKAGELYLAENKKKPGVVTLPDGIQYKVIVKGDGRLPQDGDTVEYHYRGALTNGKEFGSTYRSGQPLVARVKDAPVKGLSDILTKMPVGSRWEVVIPAQLAYGERGHGSDIGPGQVLVYEVELIAIK